MLDQETFDGEGADMKVRVALERRWMSKRLLAAVLLLAVASMTGVLLTDGPTRRVIILRGLAWAYSVYDPFANQKDIRLGPGGDGEPSAMTDEAMELKLAELFPDYDVRVSWSGPQLSSEHIHDIVFEHEDLKHQRVQQFRREASDLLTGSPDVFQLSQRVRSLAEHRLDPLAPTENDPLAILSSVRAGTSLTCRPFSLLYGQALTSRGYTARLLSLSRLGTKFNHAVTEVYVPDYGKWLVIDCDFNVAYRRKGQWLNAQELHQLWQDTKRDFHFDPDQREAFAKRVSAAREALAKQLELEMVVLGDAGQNLRDKNLYKASLTGMSLEFYEYVFYHTNNDYLSAWYPPGHPKQVTQFLLKPERSDTPNVSPEAIAPNSPHEIYWPVGRSRVEAIAGTKADGPSVEVTLATWTPNFHGFEVRDASGTWRSEPDGVFRWKLSPGHNNLEFHSVNVPGLQGEISRLTVELTQRLHTTAGQWTQSESSSRSHLWPARVGASTTNLRTRFPYATVATYDH